MFLRLSFSLSDAFRMTRLGVMDLQKEDHRGEVPLPSRPVKCTHRRCDVVTGVNLAHQADGAFARFLH